MIMGFFLVRPIPLPVQDNSDIEEGRDQHHDYLEAISSALDPHNSGRTPLLDHDDFTGGVQGSHSAVIRTGIKSARINQEFYALDDIPFRSPNGVFTPLSSQSRIPNREVASIPKRNLHGRQLWSSSDFWLLFTILAIRKSFFLRFCHLLHSLFFFFNSQWNRSGVYVGLKDAVDDVLISFLI